MNINTAVITAAVSFFAYLIYKSLIPKSKPFIPERSGLLVAQDTGKSKVNQSKTGDASLFIQKVRRAAIRSSRGIPRETHTQLGSTTGALETYFVNE